MNQESAMSEMEKRALCLACFFAVAGLDYLTGPELALSAGYVFPVSLCAWYLGRNAALLMAVASGLTVWLMDTLGGHAYSHPFYQVGNSANCVFITAGAGLVLHRLKAMLEERKIANQELRRTLEELRRSTEEIQKLQDGLQVMCGWTKQIKVDGRWMSPEEFLSTRLRLKLTHGMSPEASRQFEREVAQIEPVELSPKPAAE